MMLRAYESRGDMRELGRLYEQTRSRVVELVGGADGGRAALGSRAVPACPSWSIHDVIAHLTGICTDILSGQVEGAGTEPWTAVQVEARRAADLSDIVAEWEVVGPKIASLLDDFPGRYRSQVAADLAVHEQDIRGALNRPGARQSETVLRATDFLVSAISHPGACALGLGPLEMRAGDRSWVLGAGQATGGDTDAAIAAALASPPGRDPSPPGSEQEHAPAAAVTTAPYDLFRALSGRRSEAQIRSFAWSEDPQPYLAIFSLGPFTVRYTDLDE